MKRKKVVFLAFFFALVLTGCGRMQKQDEEVPVIAPTLKIDFLESVGTMKTLTGINNGPKSDAAITENGIQWGLDATEIYQELGVPYVRTHDMEYPNGGDRFIDIHCIFPDFSRDAEDAEAYHFEATDAYIANIRESGAEVFYRLGESIAPSVSEAQYQYPPEDFEKWADVCAHIIAHYNEGWDNGYEYNIQYWEIWNEPDQKRQWLGEIEAYYQLYQVTARHLKAVFPDIMVGGGALASASEESVQAFLDGITDDGAATPLDFFSWHIYTDTPSDITSRANMVRDTLDKNGYESTMTFLGEWNYVDDWENIETTWEAIRSPKMAAFYSACMIAMQDSKVDGALYYDGSLTGEYAQWCGLYTAKGEKLPGYYGFWAFSQLRKLQNQVEINFDRDPAAQGVYACAAAGKETDGILLANISDEVVRFQILSNSQRSKATFFRVNAENPDGMTTKQNDFAEKEILEMQAGELLYIALSAE